MQWEANNFLLFALLSKYQNESLDSDMASVVVYDVLEEAISVGAYGIGLPIEVCKIDNDGITAMDIPTLAQSANILREKERDLVKNKIWNLELSSSLVTASVTIVNCNHSPSSY